MPVALGTLATLDYLRLLAFTQVNKGGKDRSETPAYRVEPIWFRIHPCHP